MRSTAPGLGYGLCWKRGPEAVTSAPVFAESRVSRPDDHDPLHKSTPVFVIDILTSCAWLLSVLRYVIVRTNQNIIELLNHQFYCSPQAALKMVEWVWIRKQKNYPALVASWNTQLGHEVHSSIIVQLLTPHAAMSRLEKSGRVARRGIIKLFHMRCPPKMILLLYNIYWLRCKH